ncbi:hypothetical protein [Sorangium sp. So ce1099]|uniref:hypothetical protein n=1 Tax=Sorangium sp. So ce1099 TaxID=3133331 RepID=UPI003F5E6F2D
MSNDRFSSASSGGSEREGARGPYGFLVRVDGAPTLWCREVRGFHRAAVAAADPDAMPPAQLVLVGLDEATRAWLASWAEDSERVRRTMTIRRLLDDREATAVVTLASYGYGVETALAVESVVVPAGEGPAAILRSGVHTKEEIDAMLAVLATALPESEEASWFVHV